MNASMARIELYTSELTQWNLDAGSTSLKVSLSQNGTSNIQPGDGEDVALKLIGANIVGKYRQYADKILSEITRNKTHLPSCSLLSLSTWERAISILIML